MRKLNGRSCQFFTTCGHLFCGRSHIANNPPQGDNHICHGLRELADLILALHIDFGSEITMSHAIGDFNRFLKGHDNASNNQRHNKGNQYYGDNRGNENLDLQTRHLRLDVIDINATAYDPAPRLVEPDE